MQRDMCRKQYSVSVTRDTTAALERSCAEQRRRLSLAGQRAEEDAAALEDFEKENEHKAVQAVQDAENETLRKLELMAEIKSATAKMMAVKSDIARKQQIFSKYLVYKTFLTNLCPPEWKAEQERKKERAREAKRKEREGGKDKPVRLPPLSSKDHKSPALLQRQSKVTKVSTVTRPSNTPATRTPQSTSKPLDKSTDKEPSTDESESEEEAEMYFTDPNQMINILKELEDKNLSCIQNFQETEEELDEIHKSVKTTQDKVKRETEMLEQQIEMLNAAIAREKEKASELELKSRMFSFGEFNEEKQDHMLKMLNRRVEAVYRTCIGDADGKISTLHMLTSIETRIEELLECLDTLPREKVNYAKRNREKERRLRMHEEKLLQKQQHQEERLRLATERAYAHAKKTVRKLMMRSKPPTVKKKGTTDTTDAREEEIYFFT
ncbi:coiled-coil domain-containing protein 38 isoform X2 [Amia ocellicauda]|uniref:coiled-coil domain-containing protein 38 isoform X2 n=1 Tax=Amia ocellicauda TaxID=2972642 RepID=UPI0034649302